MAGQQHVPRRIKVRRGPKKGRYDRESIDAVLDRGLVAHVAFVEDEEPLCIPLLYARVGDRIYIHGSTASRAVRALGAGAPACLTVTVVDGLVLARSAFEHSANYDAVMAFGRFTPVADDAERLRAFEAFTEKLLPGALGRGSPTESQGAEGDGDSRDGDRRGLREDSQRPARRRRLARCGARHVVGGRPHPPHIRGARGITGTSGGHPALGERQAPACSSSSSWMIRSESWTQTRSSRPGPRFANL